LPKLAHTCRSPTALRFGTGVPPSAVGFSLPLPPSLPPFSPLIPQDCPPLFAPLTPRRPEPSGSPLPVRVLRRTPSRVARLAPSPEWPVRAIPSPPRGRPVAPSPPLPPYEGPSALWPHIPCGAVPPAPAAPCFSPTSTFTFFSYAFFSLDGHMAFPPPPSPRPPPCIRGLCSIIFIPSHPPGGSGPPSASHHSASLVSHPLFFPRIPPHFFPAQKTRSPRIPPAARPICSKPHPPTPLRPSPGTPPRFSISGPCSIIPAPWPPSTVPYCPCLPAPSPRISSTPPTFPPPPLFSPSFPSV